MTKNPRKKAEKIWEELLDCSDLPPDDDLGTWNCMIDVLEKHRVKEFEFADDGSDVEIKLPSGEKFVLLLEPGNPYKAIKPIKKERRRK